MTFIFFNTAFIEDSTALINPTDRGFTLADGVFDTLLAIDGQAQYALDHFNRLARHAGVLGIPLLFTPTMLAGTAQTLLAINNYASGRYAIRTTLTRGPGQRGLAPPDDPSTTLIMRASPAPANDTPLKAIIARTARRNEGSPLSRIKSLNYGDSILALMEAKRAGADDALLLNNRGNVCCLTASNIVIAESGRYITPPLTDGILDGITRARLIAAGLVQEDRIDEKRLLAANGIAAINSITGLRPFNTLNGEPFDDKTWIAFKAMG